MDLAAVLAPVSPHQFFSQYLTKEFLFLPGSSAKKFADLMPWSALNDILRHGRFDAGHLRLVKEGKAVPPETFLRFDQGKIVSTPRLLATELTEQLREGATLIINRIDQTYEPLTRLCEELERTLETPVRINLYAGWRSSRGFDLHWDDHDVFILQVSGRKHWETHGTTTRFPDDQCENVERPTAGPTWSRVVEPGDLLYIPRGCWHVAVPLEEPTLHLTVGFSNFTGVDLLRWISNRLRAQEVIRMDLPWFSNREVQIQHLTALRAAISEICSEPNLLETFRHTMNGTARTRCMFGLPETATPQILPDSDSFVIALTTSRPPIVELSETVDVSLGGKVFHYDAATRPLFDVLAKCEGRSVAAFRAELSDAYTTEQVTAFLADLVRHGIIVLQQPVTPHPAESEAINATVGGS